MIMTGYIFLNCWLFEQLDNVHYCVMVLMFVMCVLVAEIHYTQGLLHKADDLQQRRGILVQV